MIRYRTRPGVVLTTVGGQYVLVAAKSIREICPSTSEINETAAFCWRVLEEGTDFDGLFDRLSKEYEIDNPESARADLTELLEQLKNANYLIEAP